MNAICVIPARGGSQRVPRKNIRDFHGKPIIAYSIETALKSGLFGGVWVSTDDDEIADVAKKYGAEVLNRSPHMAANNIGTQEVMAWHLKFNLISTSKYACCLYATAPMLQAERLIRAYEMLECSSGTPYVVPVGTWLQDPGQFYFGKINAFLRGYPLHSSDTKMVWINPNTECDINTEEDWNRAEEMYAALHNEEKE